MVNSKIIEIAKKYNLELNSNLAMFSKEIFEAGVNNWLDKCNEGRERRKALGKPVGRQFGAKDKKKRDSTKFYKRILINNKWLKQLNPKMRDAGIKHIDNLDFINKCDYKRIKKKIKTKLINQLKKERKKLNEKK